MDLTSIPPDSWVKPALIGASVGLVFGLLGSFAVYWKCRRDKAKLQTRLDSAQMAKDQCEDQLGKTKMVLNNMKSEWDSHIRGKLSEIERKKEKNKQDLQSVETEKTQRKTLEISEDLIQKKEQLLESQWRLDEKQREYEKQLINNEKMLGSMDEAVNETKTRLLQDQNKTK